MRAFPLLFLLLLAVTAAGQRAPKGLALSDLQGTWVSKTAWTDPTTLEELSSTSTIEIRVERDGLLIRETTDSGRSVFVEEVRLKTDGSGETNRVMNRDKTFAEVASTTRLENDALIRRVPTARSWDPREFPAAIVDSYRLSRDKRKLIVTTILEGDRTGPLPPLAKGPFRFSSTFKRKGP